MTGETKLPEKTISVARALRHEGFSDTKAINDLALLELEDPVKYEANVVPACLPQASFSIWMS